MKLSNLMLLPICAGLAGCFARAETPTISVVNKSNQEIINWLSSQGYPGALITGPRNECSDLGTGYGVIVRIHSGGAPVAASGVVCEDLKGSLSLRLDQNLVISQENIIRK